jgi:CheY-like chemotaxis protein
MMKTDRIIPPEFKEKIRIMVVEDNLLNQKLASFMLKAWGFSHDIFGNGKLAVEALKQQHYDLIILDIQMPEMNGYETSVYIRNELKRGMPIIATTSHCSPEERERCLSCGMTDYLSKPIKEEELYNLVTNYLFTTVVENVENRISVQH